MHRPGFVRIAILLLIVSVLVPACREQPRSVLPVQTHTSLPDTFTVMSYNVENLFDLVHDGSEYPEYIPGRQNWNRRTHATKLANIASVITPAMPDIVVLTEVENTNALAELSRVLGKEGRNYSYSAIADRPNRTNTCPAILSRFPIIATRYYPGPILGEYFSRNTLEADILVGGDTLKVFAVHWPSARHPESTRIEAARPLAQRISSLPAHTDYLIAGDFNSNYDEKGICHGGRPIALSSQLAIVHGCSSATALFCTEDDLISLAGKCHYTTWLELPVDERYSYVYRGKKTTPDHVLLPAALYDARGVSYVDNSFHVFTAEGKLLRDGQPFRWAMRQVGARRFHLGEGYSDHLPLLLRLRRGPFTRAPRVVHP